MWAGVVLCVGLEYRLGSEETFGDRRLTWTAPWSPSRLQFPVTIWLIVCPWSPSRLQFPVTIWLIVAYVGWNGLSSASSVSTIHGYLSELSHRRARIALLVMTANDNQCNTSYCYVIMSFRFAHVVSHQFYVYYWLVPTGARSQARP